MIHSFAVHPYGHRRRRRSCIARLELTVLHLHSPDSKKPRNCEAFLCLVGLGRFELPTSTMSR